MTDSNTSFAGAGSTLSLEVVRDRISVLSATVASERQSMFGTVLQMARDSEVAIS